MKQYTLILLSSIMFQYSLSLSMNVLNNKTLKVFLKKFEPEMNRRLYPHKYYYRIGNLTNTKVFNENSIETILARFNFHQTTCKWRKQSRQPKRPFCELMPKYRACQVEIDKYSNKTFQLNTIQCSRIKGEII